MIGLNVLATLQDETEPAASPMQRLLVSDREDTLRRVAESGATAAHPRDVKAGPYEYIGLKC